MGYVSYIVAVATLAGAVAGCADPYYPRSGYSQSYYYPSGYSYYPPPSHSYPPGYTYRSSAWDRNYKGIHPGPERTFP